MIVSLLLVLVMYDYAQAYIDPSTGSYILQILLAGILGGLYAMKSYWRQLKAFFSKKSEETNEDSP